MISVESMAYLTISKLVARLVGIGRLNGCKGA